MDFKKLFSSHCVCVAKRALNEAEAKLLRRFGRKIRSAREALGWSQTELATKTSRPGSQINLRRIQSVEAGETNVSFSLALRILETLGMKSTERNVTTPNPRHIELHEQLQELLDAKPEPGRNWPEAAEVNVDAVWSLYQAKKKKGA